MPTRFEILIDRGIVYIQHSGHVTLAESHDALGRYAAHPDFAPAQKHLVDCTNVVSFEQDYARLMALQARVADVVTPDRHETLLAFLSPHPHTHETANLIKQSWEGSGIVIPRVVQTEAAALAFLGQPETRIADLLEAAVSAPES